MRQDHREKERESLLGFHVDHVSMTSTGGDDRCTTPLKVTGNFGHELLYMHFSMCSECLLECFRDAVTYIWWHTMDSVSHQVSVPVKQRMLTFTLLHKWCTFFLHFLKEEGKHFHTPPPLNILNEEVSSSSRQRKETRDASHANQLTFATKKRQRIEGRKWRKGNNDSNETTTQTKQERKWNAEWTHTYKKMCPEKIGGSFN